MCFFQETYYFFRINKVKNDFQVIWPKKFVSFFLELYTFCEDVLYC